MYIVDGVQLINPLWGGAPAEQKQFVLRISCRRMFMKRILCLISAMLLSAAMAAEENTPPASQGGRGGDRRGGEHRGGERGGRNGMRRGRFLEQLKEKYPAEVAEIEKLQQTDPAAARTRMFELMRKANPQMGRRGMPSQEQMEPTAEQLAEIRKKFPTEFAEYEKLKQGDPEKAKNLLAELMKKTFNELPAVGNSNLRDRSRRSVAMVKMELKRRYPERFAEIEKLAETDPDAARAELRKLFIESNMRMPSGAGKLNYEYVDPRLQQQFNRPGMRNWNHRQMMYGNPNWRR